MTQVSLKNPNGNFALFRYGPADVVEVERFDTLDEAKTELGKMLGADPVKLSVRDLSARQEAYAVEWPGKAPEPEVAPAAAKAGDK